MRTMEARVRRVGTPPRPAVHPMLTTAQEEEVSQVAPMA